MELFVMLLKILICTNVLCMGDPNSIRIVGGNAANPKDLPYQVSLQILVNYRQYKHFCGGSIVSRNKVLTAAHCLEHKGIAIFKTLIRVVAGIARISDIRNAQIRMVDSYERHRNFRPSKNHNYNNDIAIITVASNFRLTQTVQIIALRYEETVQGENCTVSGWGNRVSGNNKASEELIVAHVVIEDPESCKKLLLKISTENMICVSSYPNDACQGDSGGPLVCDNKLAGIVSAGVGCGEMEYPGIYTKVANYKSFVHSSSPIIHVHSNLILLNLILIMCMFIVYS